jgi:hypothetical protein
MQTIFRGKHFITLQEWTKRKLTPFSTFPTT